MRDYHLPPGSMCPCVHVNILTGYDKSVYLMVSIVMVFVVVVVIIYICKFVRVSVCLYVCVCVCVNRFICLNGRP